MKLVQSNSFMQTNLDDLYVKRKLNNIESLLAIILSNQNQNETEITMLFSEYKDAVDSTLAEVLKTIGSESDQIKAILATPSTAENPAIKTAFDELNQKRATVIEALGGLISTTPIPTPPVVLPTDPGQPLPLPVVPPTAPPVVAPVVSPGEPPVVPVAPVADPTVPITSTPSQPGVGLPNGVDLTPAPVVPTP